MKRRALLHAVLSFPAIAVATPTDSRALIEVNKNPSCSCCSAWVEHLKAHGFDVRVTEMNDPGVVRRAYGIPDQLGRCHTATVSGYVIEGHVPAADIQRLLKERPMALGLAVPGMPMGSPGMENDDRRDPFEVLLMRKNGAPTEFNRYAAQRLAQESADEQLAQISTDAASPTQAALTEGEIRKIDKAQGKITVRHGRIVNLDMPAMTMVFKVSDPAVLDRFKPGDKVLFAAELQQGALVVTQIQILY